MPLPTPRRGSKRCSLAPSPETDLPFMQQTTHSSKRLSGQPLRVRCLSPTKTSRNCYHLPGLAWSCETPTQNPGRPMRWPRVTAICRGSDQAPIQMSPVPHSPHTAEMEHGEGRQPIPRPHARASCLCGPSVTWFSGQSDPESAHPDENNSQGANPHLSTPHPHSQGCRNPALAQEASTSACSLSVSAILLLQTSQGLDTS